MNAVAVYGLLVAGHLAAAQVHIVLMAVHVIINSWRDAWGGFSMLVPMATTHEMAAAPVLYLSYLMLLPINFV